MNKYIKTFGELNQIAVTNGQLKVIIKEGIINEFDKNQLINELNLTTLD